MIKLGNDEVEARYITDSNGVPHEVVAAYVGNNLVYSAKIEEVNAEFYYRKTGGTQSVGSGIAAIKEVRGKSIVWNQLIKNGNFSNGVNGWSTNRCTITSDNNICAITLVGKASTSSIGAIDTTFIINHDYLVKFDIQCDSATSTNTLNVFAAVDAFVRRGIEYNDNGGVKNVSFIRTASKTATGGLSIYPNANQMLPSGSIIYVSNVMCIDLTLMFGAGNEPTTVAEFEKMFPLDYYDYNAGEVIPFAGQNLTTTGKNQYNPTSGKANLLGGQQYQISGAYTKLYPTVSLVDYTYGSPVTMYTYYTNANSHYVGAKTVSAYDNTNTYALGAYCVYDNAVYKANVAIDTAEEFDSTKWDVIADVAAMVTEGIFTLWDITPDANGLFTLTKDTEVTIVGGNNTNTIVALYNGENVTYEPYEKHTLPLDPSQWRDKQGNLVFPYGGMHGVGGVYDYAKVDADGYIRKAVRCFWQVDLGTLKYIRDYTGSYYAFKTGNPAKRLSINTSIVSTKLEKSTGVDSLKNETYGIGASVMAIRYDSYTNVTDFKNAMQGVMLVYELATPVKVELATPIYAKYLVDKDGTEEITPANGTTPYTTMANLHLAYRKK